MTRRILGIALLSVLAAAARPAGASEAEVLAAHEARFAATLKADLSALSALLTDDMTYTHASAKTETKAEFVELLRTGHYQYKAIVPSERKVRLYGDAALVGGIVDVDVISGGAPVKVKLRFLEAWVKRAGRWQLAAWQSTRFPPPAP
jgi:ketosteroid isomerase-like protein